MLDLTCVRPLLDLPETIRGGLSAPTAGAQVYNLCEGVTVAPPAENEMDAFFAEPSHIIARVARDVLTMGNVAETLLDIMPAIVQVRTTLRQALGTASITMYYGG